MICQIESFCIFVFMRYNNKKVENLNSFFVLLLFNIKLNIIA